MITLNMPLKKVVALLIIVALLLPLQTYALSQEEAAWKNEEMIKKFAAGDQEGAYQIFLELESSGIAGFKGFFIPQTDAEIATFQAGLKKQNISKNVDEIQSYAQGMDKLNRKMFRSYMQQDAQGVLQAAQEINALSVRFLQADSTQLPKDVAPAEGSASPALPGSLPTEKEEGPVFTAAPPATEEEIERWEKLLEDSLAETNYLETTRKILNYTKTGVKLSGKLAKVPLIGMLFDAVNIPFDSLENYQMGDNVFKAFGKSLSANTLHAVTNLVIGTPAFLRKLVDDLLDTPVEERPGVQDYRYFVKSVNNIFWDNGFSWTLGEGIGGLDIEELDRRHKLGHYGNRYMDPDYNQRE